LVRGEGRTRWRERGWESPNSDEGTYTVVLFIYMYFVKTTICGRKIAEIKSKRGVTNAGRESRKGRIAPLVKCGNKDPVSKMIPQPETQYPGSQPSLSRAYRCTV
jgi:hypothetical protein